MHENDQMAMIYSKHDWSFLACFEMILMDLRALIEDSMTIKTSWVNWELEMYCNDVWNSFSIEVESRFW